MEFLLWFHSVSYISTRVTVKFRSPLSQAAIYLTFLYDLTMLKAQSFLHVHGLLTSFLWTLPILDCFAGT